ncbi:MmcQ/YjbR family DNA-binding protein, partial [Burkholderia multivorans]
TTKVLAYFGDADKDVTVEIEQHPHSVLLLLDPLDAEVMLEREDTFVPMYLGPTGWIGLDLADVAEDELRDLLGDSYRSTAPARLARLIHDAPADEAES